MVMIAAHAAVSTRQADLRELCGRDEGMGGVLVPFAVSMVVWFFLEVLSGMGGVCRYMCRLRRSSEVWKEFMHGATVC